MSEFKNHPLTLVEFNVENLFVLLDAAPEELLITLPQEIPEPQWQKFSRSITPNKPFIQIKQLARAILDMKADIVMLCEVGGRESLVNFNRHFLGDRFHVQLIEVNSERGIDLGYLVAKDLPVKIDLHSHKHRALDFNYPHELQSLATGYLEQKKIHRFSRDVLELRLFTKDEALPDLIILLTHLKSQLDRERIDPAGRDRRRAEFDKLIEIYLELETQFANVPIILAGDFNGSVVQTEVDSEFRSLREKTNLKDVLEIAEVKPDDRFTFMQLSQNNRPGRLRQLDYIFVPPSLADKIDKTQTRVFRFNDELGFPMPVPRNLNEKKTLPSDHYPIVLSLRGL